MVEVVPITAVFPTYNRFECALRTLAEIKECDPVPAEILVEVDGGKHDLAEMIRQAHPDVKVTVSLERSGPGGVRNRLIRQATHELVANFDDDSFPRHRDYFARVAQTAARFPNAAMISAASMESEWREPEFLQIAVASGCGCVFRKSWFEKTVGFVPLPIAYAMEEVDVSLQVCALGGGIVHDPFLRVKHDRVLPRIPDATTNAHILANTALLPYLRFPAWLWIVGVWQVLFRLISSILHGRTAGLMEGFRMMPDFLHRRRHLRKNVSSPAILRWLLLRRRRVSLGRAEPLPTSQFK